LFALIKKKRCAARREILFLKFGPAAEKVGQPCCTSYTVEKMLVKIKSYGKAIPVTDHEGI
jgi:hypothetical protein